MPFGALVRVYWAHVLGAPHFTALVGKRIASSLSEEIEKVDFTHFSQLLIGNKNKRVSKISSKWLSFSRPQVARVSLSKVAIRFSLFCSRACTCYSHIPSDCQIAQWTHYSYCRPARALPDVNHTCMCYLTVGMSTMSFSRAASQQAQAHAQC